MPTFANQKALRREVAETKKRFMAAVETHGDIETAATQLIAAARNYRLALVSMVRTGSLTAPRRVA
jgi:hypothetical protein